MNRYNLPLPGHAATDMGDIGRGNDYKQFELSHKPGVASLNCRE